MLVNELMVALSAGKIENQAFSSVFPGRRIKNATTAGTNTEINPIERFLLALLMPQYPNFNKIPISVIILSTSSLSEII